MNSNYTKSTACYYHETVVKYVDNSEVAYYCFDCDEVQTRSLDDIRLQFGLEPTKLRNEDSSPKEAAQLELNTLQYQP